MAALPPLKRITAEDFSEQISWIAKLLQPLNVFFDSVYSALNKNLTFADNFKAMVKTVVVDNTQATFTPIKISSTIGRPAGVWAVSVRDRAGNSQVLGGGGTVSWGYENGQILINAISGLTTLSSGTTTNTSATLSNVTNANHLLIGQSVAGTGIPTNTKISSISGSSVIMTNAATASASGVLLVFSGKSYDLTFIAVAG